MQRRALGSVLVSLGLLVAMAHCDRAPAEPVAAAAPRQKTRCLRPTPERAPDAVPKGPDPRCPEDPEGGPPKVPLGKIVFEGASSAPAVEAELMLTEKHRERGLMWRREMPEAHGMLFVFEGDDVRTFWMRNTCLPLDMLFVAEDGYVTGIVENVPTMNDDPRTVPCKVKYVLELNAGFARRHGVRAGQKLRIEGLP